MQSIACPSFQKVSHFPLNNALSAVQPPPNIQHNVRDDMFHEIGFTSVLHKDPDNCSAWVASPHYNLVSPKGSVLLNNASGMFVCVNRYLQRFFGCPTLWIHVVAIDDCWSQTVGGSTRVRSCNNISRH